MQQISSPIWWAFCALGVTVAVISAAAGMMAPPEPSAPVTDSAGAVRQLSGIIRARGVDAAQAFFLKHFFSYSDNHRHYLGHLIGEHIYKTYGMDGISRCYSSMEFGCIHGFLLTGYMDRGDPFLDAVISRCSQDLPEGCMHGLGHAFLLIRGYDIADVRSSIDACLALSTQLPYRQQCIQGVYMEYNDRFLVDGSLSANSFKPRAYDPDNPYAPCDTEPAQLQPICYRELVLYWSNISTLNPELMADLCNGLSGENRYECYWSLGGLVAGDSKEIESPLVECLQFAPKDLSACLKGAVLSVAFQSQRPRSEFCAPLPAAVAKECRTW